MYPVWGAQVRFCFLKNRQNPGDSKVLIGVLSTYGAMEFSLRVLMQVFFGDSRSQDTCRGEAVVWFQFFFVRVLPCRVYTWSNSLESRDLSLSASLDLSLKKWALPKDVEILLGHVGLFPRYLMAVTVICTLAVAVVFFTSYNWLLKPRIEGEHNLPPLLHFTKNVASHLVAFRCRVECLSSPEPPAQVLKRRQLNSLEHQSVAVQPCGTHEST